MRCIIVFCLVAAASADKLGYNYKPVGHSDFGLSFNPGSASGYGVSGSHGVVGSHGVGGIQGVGGFHSGGIPHGGSNGFVGNSGYGGPVGGFGAGFFNGGSNIGSHVGPSVGFNGGANVGSSVGSGDVSYAPQAELEKEFYSFQANENDFSVPHIENQVANSAKRGLRVIFIKGPENNGVENAAVALAKHIAEQKTAIYVLQKQADLNSLTQKLNTISSNINHKPEVHFVKYRTPEDAANAQRAIQGQYESLGGISKNYNGGETPVLNFASKAPVAAPHSAFGPSASIGSSGVPGLSGSVGSSGSYENSGPGASIGSIGSSGLSSSSDSYIPPSAPSSSYLPA